MISVHNILVRSRRGKRRQVVGSPPGGANYPAFAWKKPSATTRANFAAKFLETLAHHAASLNTAIACQITLPPSILLERVDMSGSDGLKARKSTGANGGQSLDNNYSSNHGRTSSDSSKRRLHATTPSKGAKEGTKEKDWFPVHSS